MTELSTEFRNAVAATAVTCLADGVHSLEGAASYVAEKPDELVFPEDRGRVSKAQSILRYRDSILGVENGDRATEELAVALYHYDSCLRWVVDNGLSAESADDILIESLIETH